MKVRGLVGHFCNPAREPQSLCCVGWKVSWARRIWDTRIPAVSAQARRSPHSLSLTAVPPLALLSINSPQLSYEQ